MAGHSLMNLYGDPDRDVYRGITAAVRAAELPDEAFNEFSNAPFEFENSAQLSLLARMDEMLERLANVEFIVNLDVNGQRFARATATASDEVSGARLNLRERGLAL